MTMASGIVQKEEVIRIKAEKAAKAAAEKAKAKEELDALPVTDKIKVVAAEVLETTVVGVKSTSKRSKKIVGDVPPLQVVNRPAQDNESVVLVTGTDSVNPTAVAPALVIVDDVTAGQDLSAVPVAPMHTLQNNVVEPVPAINW